MSLVLDLAIAAILIVMIVLGYRRGLILSLFSLISVLVALVGALILTNIFAPMLRDALVPAFEEKLRPVVQEVLPQGSAGSHQELEEALSALEQKELPLHLNDLLGEISPSELSLSSAAEDLLRALALIPSAAIAFCSVGLASFILMLLAWKLLAHLLNWIAKLPVLNTLNRSGGVLIGAFEGVFLVLLAVSVLSKVSLLPQSVTENSLFLPLVLKLAFLI